MIVTSVFTERPDRHVMTSVIVVNSDTELSKSAGGFQYYIARSKNSGLKNLFHHSNEAEVKCFHFVTL